MHGVALVSCVLVVVSGLSAQQPATLRLARAFGDHMVLQRDRPLRVWGAAAPGQQVEVRFADHAANGRTDEAGNWLVELPPMQGCERGRDLVVVADATVTLRDVVVGDVWLCSGQSNMAMGLDSCGDGAARNTPELPAIRFRGHFEHFAGVPQADLRDAVEWRVLGLGTAASCTAVGYWFARTVQPVAGVPIGLLTCAVGGTEIECWMPPEAFAEAPELAPITAQLHEAIAAWQRGLRDGLPRVEAWLVEAHAAAAAGRPIPSAPRLPGHPNEDRDQWVRTQSLWNGMVHPLTRLPLRGVLWYQGENNGHEQDLYASKMRALVATWRRAFGQQLPFYYVQLPGYGQPSDDPAGGDPGFAPCRMAQLQCARLPGVGMAVTIDAGEALDIHPKDKRTVGERLARWALRDLYGQSIEPSGPLFAAAVREGAAMRVRFDHAAGGLEVADAAPGTVAELRGFSIAGADRRWHRAQATIDGETVVVRAGEVPEPVAVRYAYAANPTAANLRNTAGLPASPFRSDDW